MNIAIDVSPLQTGHAGRGVGVYTDNLIKSLKQYQSHNTYILFTRKQKLPNNVDLVHVPYFDPFFVTLRLYLKYPLVVTVHDLIPIVYPDLFPRGFKGEIKWQIQKALLRRSSGIITDSHASKKDIQTETGISEDRINVVYLAPEYNYRPQTDIRKLNKIREKYQTGQNYILYVGDVNRNKNIINLLRAFSLIADRFTDTNLVLVGKAFLNRNLDESVEIEHVINELKLDKRVVRTGFVNNQDLADLYSGAGVYTQPSLAEGFGLPVLEAMACGCPVCLSDTSSLPEIAGPSIRFKPDETTDIADKISILIGLKNTDRDKMIKDGISWVKNFSWKKTAEQTVQVYEKTISR